MGSPAAGFERATRRFIAEQGLLHSGSPVIVALSGGADSVALLAVLTALGYECVAAHCNYHLRGEESNRDMHHARRIAAELGAEFCVRHFDMETELASHPGETLEMGCRRVRYAWFGVLADRAGAQAVAVGHHCEDRAETFVLNLMRGAGVVGLTSMNPRNGSTVRPLLWATRSGVEEYLEARGLSFVTDSTNATDDFTRNRIRHRVLPYLEGEFAGAMEAILRSVANLESVRRIFLDYVEGVRLRVVDDRGRYDLRALRTEPEAVAILLELLRGKGFTPTQISDMLRSAVGSGQRFHSSAGIVAEVDRGLMSLRFDAETATAATETRVSLRRDITTPLKIRITSHPVEDFRIPGRNASVAYLDAVFALEPSAVWTVRRWRRGDRMTPFGSTASKLVSDIFATARYSASDKRRAWLLLRNGEIVWIPGLRNSALGAVGPESRRYLRLEYISEGEIEEVNEGEDVDEVDLDD